MNAGGYTNANEDGSGSLDEKMHEVGEKAREGVNALKTQGGNVYSSVRDLAKEAVSEAKSAGQHTFDQVCAQGTQTIERLEGTVRQEPIRSLLFATGLGFILGAVLARR